MIHHMVKERACPRHARIALQRIRELASKQAVRITSKVQAEMDALEPPADIDDVVEVLSLLTSDDWQRRVCSELTGEPMHVFKPVTVHGLLYVKVVIRGNCVVVSFHEEVES
jgi:hypothetical protein